MGVLDDAIRQHIELKRQHGASEQELQRKQDEALGPARRDAPAESSEDGDNAHDDASEPADTPGSGPSETPFSEQETRVFSAPDEADAPVSAPDEASAPVAAPIEDWLEPEDEPEEEPEDDPADEPEDVLEETPDFLQETPEHDRLWFEQKPPRDFDFDDK